MLMDETPRRGVRPESQTLHVSQKILRLAYPMESAKVWNDISIVSNLVDHNRLRCRSDAD